MNVAALLGNALLGPVGGPREMPRPIQTIDPNIPIGINPDAPRPGAAQLLGNPVVEQAAPRQEQPAPRKKRSGVRNFLGNLGDALLIGSGAAPIYRPKVAREELGEALAQYLGADDPALVELVRGNPEAGMQFYNARREDKRFERTAGQDDMRIGQGQQQIDLGRDELAERRRANQAGEAITVRGQDVSSGTQINIAQMRQQDAQADRAFRAAMAEGDHQRAKELLGYRAELQRQMAAMGGTITETIEYPAQEGDPGSGGFLGIGKRPAVEAQPERTVTVKRPAGVQPAASAAPSQADLEFTAKKHGISVAEVKRRLGIN